MAYGTVNADVIGTSVSGSNLGAGNASTMKNRIINGAMVLNQRGSGTLTLSGSNQYPVDRFIASVDTSATVTAQQSSTAPAGFNNSLLITVTTGASPSASNENKITQRIEGYNVADLNFGTVNAKTITFSFWVYSSLTGTFGGTLRNSDASRSYPYTYTISSANTWTQISVTVAGDTSGTWLTTNGTGLQLTFDLGSGSSVKGTAGSWQSANYTGATGTTNLVATTGATFYITGVQLEVGSSATGYEYRQYGQELALCQRYYYNYANGTYSQIGSGGFYTAGQWECEVYFPVSMRTTPSATIASGTNYYRIITTGSQYYFNSLNATNFSLNVCLLYTSSGISATAGAYGRCDVNGSGAISFSAEL